jgi:hypothetical protein
MPPQTIVSSEEPNLESSKLPSVQSCSYSYDVEENPNKDYLDSPTPNYVPTTTTVLLPSSSVNNKNNKQEEIEKNNINLVFKATSHSSDENQQNIETSNNQQAIKNNVVNANTDNNNIPPTPPNNRKVSGSNEEPEDEFSQERIIRHRKNLDLLASLSKLLWSNENVTTKEIELFNRPSLKINIQRWHADAIYIDSIKDINIVVDILNKLPSDSYNSNNFLILIPSSKEVEFNLQKTLENFKSSLPVAEFIEVARNEKLINMLYNGLLNRSQEIIANDPDYLPLKLQNRLNNSHNISEVLNWAKQNSTVPLVLTSNVANDLTQTVVREVFLKMLDEGHLREEKIFPIYCSAKSYNRGNLKDYVATYLGWSLNGDFRQTGIVDLFNQACSVSDTKLVLVIDGISEIAHDPRVPASEQTLDRDKRMKFIEQVNSFSLQYPNIKILITAQESLWQEDIEDFNAQGLSIRHESHKLIVNEEPWLTLPPNLAYLQDFEALAPILAKPSLALMLCACANPQFIEELVNIDSEKRVGRLYAEYINGALQETGCGGTSRDFPISFIYETLRYIARDSLEISENQSFANLERENSVDLFSLLRATGFFVDLPDGVRSEDPNKAIFRFANNNIRNLLAAAPINLIEFSEQYQNVPSLSELASFNLNYPTNNSLGFILRANQIVHKTLNEKGFYEDIETIYYPYSGADITPDLEIYDYASFAQPDFINLNPVLITQYPDFSLGQSSDDYRFVADPTNIEHYANDDGKKTIILNGGDINLSDYISNLLDNSILYPGDQIVVLNKKKITAIKEMNSPYLQEVIDEDLTTMNEDLNAFSSYNPFMVDDGSIMTIPQPLLPPTGICVFRVIEPKPLDEKEIDDSINIGKLKEVLDNSLRDIPGIDNLLNDDSAKSLLSFVYYNSSDTQELIEILTATNGSLPQQLSHLVNSAMTTVMMKRSHDDLRFDGYSLYVFLKIVASNTTNNQRGVIDDEFTAKMSNWLSGACGLDDVSSEAIFNTLANTALFNCFNINGKKSVELNDGFLSDRILKNGFNPSSAGTNMEITQNALNQALEEIMLEKVLGVDEQILELHNSIFDLENAPKSSKVASAINFNLDIYRLIRNLPEVEHVVLINSGIDNTAQEYFSNVTRINPISEAEMIDTHQLQISNSSSVRYDVYQTHPLDNIVANLGNIKDSKAVIVYDLDMTNRDAAFNLSSIVDNLEIDDYLIFVDEDNYYNYWEDILLENSDIQNNLLPIELLSGIQNERLEQIISAAYHLPSDKVSSFKVPYKQISILKIFQKQ